MKIFHLLIFLKKRYLIIKYVAHTLENAIIVSLGLIDMCPKKIGFKKDIKKTILPTFLLKSLPAIFEIPKIASKEKNKLIK
jgi:hypothetical protein